MHNLSIAQILYKLDLYTAIPSSGDMPHMLLLIHSSLLIRLFYFASKIRLQTKFHFPILLKKHALFGY